MLTSSLVFACYEAACRPPTAGGTGGSSRKGGTLADLIEPRAAPFGQRPAGKSNPAVATGLKILKSPRGAGSFPPDSYGAGGWSEGQDGLWITATKPKKYAIKGPDTGEWMVAHTLNSRDILKPEEVHRALKQLDYLHGRFPLRIRPELVVGNFTTKGVVGNDSMGFTISSKTGDDAGPTVQRGREVLFKRSMRENYGEFPIGPNVIYLNTHKNALEGIRDPAIARRRNETFLGPTFQHDDPLQYYVTHEYGHLRAHQRVDKREKWVNTMKELVRQGEQPVSRYGRLNASEAHAESFADWVHSNGMTTNTFTYVLATELDWPMPNSTGRG